MIAKFGAATLREVEARLEQVATDHGHADLPAVVGEHDYWRRLPILLRATRAVGPRTKGKVVVLLGSWLGRANQSVLGWRASG